MLIALKVLAYDLSGCEICGILLHLPHTIEILTCGLDSFMKVQCKNTCEHQNIIPTLNVPIGMMHSGIRPSQVNAL